MSTRAAADSAARAGYDVTALDAYADVDQHASVRALSLPRDFGEPFSPQAIVAAARDLPGDALVYLSNFENHPAQVEALAAGRALWGNAPGVLRQVRDPKMLADSFAQQGIRAPRVLSTGKKRTERTTGVERWVSKPRSSGGGHGVRLWRAGESLPHGHFLQELVEGVPGSVVFVAAGGRGVALATSRQLVGESAFGASGFRYCGSILSPASTAEVAGAAITLVDAVTAAFPLVGVGAIDFIETDEGLSPVEVNPRWSASMELVERARGVSMFGIHADACAKHVLPTFDFRDGVATAAYGKAILFAHRDVVVGDIRRSADEHSVRDVPRPGERIAEGQPICTVLAASSDDASCYAMLVERAERIYEELAM
jgi:predicted ATP-grasp superfamily ATP-dependent carboligase